MWNLLRWIFLVNNKIYPIHHFLCPTHIMFLYWSNSFVQFQLGFLSSVPGMRNPLRQLGISVCLTILKSFLQKIYEVNGCLAKHRPKQSIFGPLKGHFGQSVPENARRPPERAPTRKAKVSKVISQDMGKLWSHWVRSVWGQSSEGAIWA